MWPFEGLRTVEGYSNNHDLEINSYVEDVLEQVEPGGRKARKVRGPELNYRITEGLRQEYQAFLLGGGGGLRSPSPGDF